MKPCLLYTSYKLSFSPAMQRYLKEHQRDFMPEDTKAGKAAAEQAKAERPPKEKPSRSARWAYYNSDPVNNPRGDQPNYDKDQIYFAASGDPDLVS